MTTAELSATLSDMKLAFSTLGCPDWDLKQVVAKAVEFGFQGFDLRSLNGTNELLSLPEFTSDLSASIDLVAESGLELTCFSSSVKAFAGGNDLQKYVEELDGTLELCRAFGVKRIRIFGGEIGDTAHEDAIRIVVDNCRRYLDAAEREEVTLLFETHDAWTDTSVVKRVIETVDSRYLRVVWDVAHPFRHSGETPVESWKNIGPWVANTHWKDAYPAEPTAEINRDFRLCLLGDGTLPLAEMHKVLLDGGYDGYFTLEWEKMWHPYLDDAETAFPHYVSYMKTLEEKAK